MITRESSRLSLRQKPIVVSDWEGPWVFADHAYDIAVEVIKNNEKGSKLFSAIGDYVIYLTDVRRMEGVQPGETLALITPFMK